MYIFTLSHMLLNTFCLLSVSCLQLPLPGHRMLVGMLLTLKAFSSNGVHHHLNIRMDWFECTSSMSQKWTQELSSSTPLSTHSTHSVHSTHTTHTNLWLKLLLWLQDHPPLPSVFKQAKMVNSNSIVTVREFHLIIKLCIWFLSKLPACRILHRHVCISSKVSACTDTMIPISKLQADELLIKMFMTASNTQWKWM